LLLRSSYEPLQISAYVFSCRGFIPATKEEASASIVLFFLQLIFHRQVPIIFHVTKFWQIIICSLRVLPSHFYFLFRSTVMRILGGRPMLERPKKNLQLEGWSSWTGTISYWEFLCYTFCSPRALLILTNSFNPTNC